MFLTDTHTHLFAAEFDADRKELIDNAINIGVQRFYLPNIEESSINPMLEVCRQFPQHCRPMIGLHPCSVKENFREQLDHIFSFMNHERFAAIGEIGIDLYWDKTLVEQQKQAFVLQVEKAIETNLPVAIHSRESFDMIAEILEEIIRDRNLGRSDLRGIFHCFTGTKKQAERAINMGFYLGIGGVLTFKNSGLWILHHSNSSTGVNQ